MGKIEWIHDLAERRRIARQIRGKAIEALQKSDLNEILELAGADRSNEASAALKAVLAEKLTEYTVKAMKEAKARKIGMSAAAIIIAASKAK